MPNYLSNRKPEFKSKVVKFGTIKEFAYDKTLKDEVKAGTITKQEAVDILEDMLMIREAEEMIVKIRSGAYESVKNFEYRGPTHLSVGQEATSVGACIGMKADDQITSTHRGHGDSIAKGCVAIRAMSVERLQKRVPNCNSKDIKVLVEAALEDHIYRTCAELFGKEDGYCKGRGGGMHIADFTVGHLGANAIVGGGVPIATGAAMTSRYLQDGKVTCCFAGDGAYANGVVLESLNWAAMGQFSNYLSKDKKGGLPIIFAIINNHYGMTGRVDDEVSGVECLAKRAAGFAENMMHAEVINGMDVMAVRDAFKRASEGCRKGDGPYLLEFDTYRYYGHSLSDPRNEYRTKEEESQWRCVDAIDAYEKQILDAGVLNKKTLEELKKRVVDRNARAAAAAAASADPVAADVIRYTNTNTACDVVPEKYSKVKIIKPVPEIKRKDGQLTYKDAIKETLVQEMIRDNRVIFYGEDVADYGGAFKVTKDLLEAFGRDRVFNSPISEACICGTAVGAAMTGLRPIVELMYMDFALMASDQIANQAAKWHYMSGAKAEVPLVIRASVGGGKGYGGQHSQSIESMFAGFPGMYIIYPSTPADAKGLLTTCIRDNNPIMFVESQLLYGIKGVVPEGDYMIPLGVADVKREGKDLTIVTWGPSVHDSLKAAEMLAAEKKISVEVIDLRSIVPLDMETVIKSIKKTGKCVVVSQCISMGSFTGEVASQIMEQAFDYLDAPVLRLGAKNGIAPQSLPLELAFLPNAKDIMNTALKVM